MGFTCFHNPRQNNFRIHRTWLFFNWNHVVSVTNIYYLKRKAYKRIQFKTKRLKVLRASKYKYKKKKQAASSLRIFTSDWRLFKNVKKNSLLYINEHLTLSVFKFSWQIGWKTFIFVFQTNKKKRKKNTLIVCYGNSFSHPQVLP